MRELKRDERGQSVIEFVLTMAVLFSFSIFFVHLSLVLAWGSYVQYATHMAARAFQSAGPDPAEQAERARNVITRMLKKSENPSEDRVNSIAMGADGPGGASSDVKGLTIGSHEKFNRDTRKYSWMEGVRYTFKSRLFLMPVGKSPAVRGGPGKNELTLTSEAWLSRDPTYKECKEYMEKVTKGIFDNGC